MSGPIVIPSDAWAALAMVLALALAATLALSVFIRSGEPLERRKPPPRRYKRRRRLR